MILKFLISLAVVVVCLYSDSSDTKLMDPVQLTATNFDMWVSEQIERHQTPVYCEVVVARLKAERVTNDRSISKCVEQVINFENAGRKAGNHHPKGLRYIDEILGVIGENDLAKAKLLNRKGTLLVQENAFEAASQQFGDATKFSDSARLEADWVHQNALVSLGQSLLSARKQSDAEHYFLLALSYPWYTIVNHADELQRFRDLYVLAGRGLIDVRRNDETALKSITFVPAAMNELGPVLNQAIQNAAK